MKLVYFAWVRERVGRTDEGDRASRRDRHVAELVRWLKARGEEYGMRFENEGIVRAAIDHVHVKPEARIAGRSPSFHR